jgi:DUF971 family protein
MDKFVPVNVHLMKLRGLAITWGDGVRTEVGLGVLRRECPCAGCKGERDLLGKVRMPVVTTQHEGPMTAVGAELVGNYGLKIEWADGHSAGIYTFEFLRELGEREGAGGAEGGGGDQKTGGQGEGGVDVEG